MSKSITSRLNRYLTIGTYPLGCNTNYTKPTFYKKKQRAKTKASRLANKIRRMK